jgi:hypothetical protein
VTLDFFDEGARVMEASGTAQGVVKAAALLLVVLEMVAFAVAALLPHRLLQAQRWTLASFAVAVLAFECVTVTLVQYGIAENAARVASASENRVAELRASIEAKRASAVQRRAAAAVAAQSAILASRLSAAESYAAADALDARADVLAAEMAQLEAVKPSPVAAILGESGTLAYAVARGLLVSAGGLVMFGVAGALLRTARTAGAVSIPTPEHAHPMAAAPDALPSVVRKEVSVPFALPK